jgi:hypothetical protein
MTVETITDTGTTSWVCPDYVESVVIECWGGGGNGGHQLTNGAAGGGGGGAYAKKTLAVVPGNTYSLQIGLGSVELAGGHTWFGASGTVLASPGINGVTGTTPGGAGGSAATSVGDVVYAGGSGGAGVSGSAGGGGGAGAETTAAGQSGSTPAPGTGTYPGGSGAAIQGNGQASPGRVGGGGGALRTSSGTRLGGSGGHGQIQLTYTEGVTVAQVQSRYTRRVNGAAVGGDNYLGINVPNGGSSAGSTRNNGGTILRAGSVASSLWDNLNIGLRYALTGPIVYNTSALSGSRKQNDVALSGGNFATMTAGRYIMRRVTTTLAGQSNTVLRSPASNYGERKGIHKATAWRTKFAGTLTYTVTSSTIEELTDGTARPRYTYAWVYSLQNVVGEQNSSATNPASLGANVDAASTPSIAVPGQLIYRNGSRIPKLDLYKPRTQA